MSFYRKKPVVVEAMRFQKPYKAVSAWCSDLKLARAMTSTSVAFGLVHTREGTMRVDIGDWIIKGVEGEFYPCKPSIFAATYEEVKP